MKTVRRKIKPPQFEVGDKVKIICDITLKEKFGVIISQHPASIRKGGHKINCWNIKLKNLDIVSYWDDDLEKVTE